MADPSIQALSCEYESQCTLFVVAAGKMGQPEPIFRGSYWGMH
ncbi:MAG: hypothetical protein OSB72_06800 [Gammaproteobacteria bacterium]|nr:hypothetical protein [Gammaproteobacteria bacterium]